jgi:mannose-1-phosphate guanylyltransferase
MKNPCPFQDIQRLKNKYVSESVSLSEIGLKSRLSGRKAGDRLRLAISMAIPIPIWPTLRFTEKERTKGFHIGGADYLPIAICFNPRLNILTSHTSAGDAMAGRRFKTAFILGAGLGTRLRPLTEQCPKPLLEIGGRPVITYAMDHLLGVGVERFIVNTHHRPEVYLEKFPDRQWRGAPIIFRHEPVLLDTAGGLKNIEDLLSGDQSILCYNGDIFADFPLQDLLLLHDRRQPEATMVLRSRGPLLNVSINARGEICDLRNALNNRGVQSCLFTGIYAVETSLLRHIEAGRTESIISIFLQRIAGNPGPVLGIIIDEGNWHDIGSLDAYIKLKNRPGLPEEY